MQRLHTFNQFFFFCSFLSLFYFLVSDGGFHSNCTLSGLTVPIPKIMPTDVPHRLIKDLSQGPTVYQFSTSCRLDPQEAKNFIHKHKFLTLLTIFHPPLENNQVPFHCPILFLHIPNHILQLHYYRKIPQIRVNCSSKDINPF